MSASPAYGPWLTVLAFALTSGAASRFFGAGWREIALAAAVGLTVGLLTLLAARFAGVARLFEVIAGGAVSLLAVIGAHFLGPLSVPVVTVGGLIVLVPGLTLTVAVTELALRNLVSGTARLMGAVVIFLLIGFGVALGGSLGRALVGGVQLVEPEALPLWTELVALLVAGFTFAILFRAPRRDIGWVILSGVVAYAGVRTGSVLLGPELGVFVGAMLVGAGSNLYARFLHRPAMVTRVPGMMLLVPGGLGFLGLSSLLEQDVLSGIQTAFTVGLIAVALVTGLLVSNALLPPRKLL